MILRVELCVLTSDLIAISVPRSFPFRKQQQQTVGTAWNSQLSSPHVSQCIISRRPIGQGTHRASGKLTANSLLLNMAIETVDLPIKHGDFP